MNRLLVEVPAENGSVSGFHVGPSKFGEKIDSYSAGNRQESDLQTLKRPERTLSLLRQP